MRDRIIYAGYLVRCPLGGYAWQVLHYPRLRALGFDVYSTRTPPRRGSVRPGARPERHRLRVRLRLRWSVLERFGFADRWVFHDVRRDRFAGLDRDATDPVPRGAC
jgi:hypothetical protein